MTSIFENTKSKVTVHILHDDTLTDDNRQKFIRTAEKYSQGLELHDVTKYRERLGSKVIERFRSRFTVGALYRFTLQDVLPLDKVIYLDCDVLVNLDISELWAVDTDDNCLAGVLDECVSNSTRFAYDRIKCRVNGCCASSYINSGVLVVNLQKIRRELGDLFTVAAKYLISHPHSTNYADQDVFNSLFADSIKHIDKKFNRQNHNNIHTGLDDDDLSGTIIHTIWPKPWEWLSLTKPDIIYWDMFIKSAWGENLSKIELVKVLLSVSDSCRISPQAQIKRFLLQKWQGTFFKRTLSIIKMLAVDFLLKLKRS